MQRRRRRAGGLPALRFNFRGVGKSTGSYGHGIGEVENMSGRRSIFLAVRFPAVPVCLIGFSFGASAVLRLGAPDQRGGALLTIQAVPVPFMKLDFLLGVLKPKLIVQGTLDQFGPRAAVEAFYNSLAEPEANPTGFRVRIISSRGSSKRSREFISDFLESGAEFAGSRLGSCRSPKLTIPVIPSAARNLPCGQWRKQPGRDSSRSLP